MEHHHTQGRPSWTPTLYSSAGMGAITASANATSAYESLRESAYAAEPPQYQSQYPQQQQPNNYRYPYDETARPTLDTRGASFVPFSLPPPREDSRLRYPPPSLPRPLVGGSLSPHIRTAGKTSPAGPPIPTPDFSVAKPGDPTTPKRATDEERRAKHREAQRRFVKRKKIEMLQLKQLAVELEKRHDLLQAVSEREALARENGALEKQLEAQQARQSPSGSNSAAPVTEVRSAFVAWWVEVDASFLICYCCCLKQVKQEQNEPSPQIEWETRTFEW
ncbi:hypothetical protein BBJ28_00007746 [Nothophytophthora sp. Chile5]|nr:hypothetical protein BBJ28_00007746 [Nothophytophthora sp. Chile5]